MRKLMKRWLFLVAIITTIILCCTSCGVTYAESIEEYETQISTNNAQVQQLEEIKAQLHIVAELLRNNAYINNDFDKVLSMKWHECNNYQTEKYGENIELQGKIESLKAEQNKRRFVGYFKITHYCPCSTCNGGWGNITALGTRLTPYKTIAVDPKVIPLGSKVEINGSTYIAEDTGVAIKGNKIDLCVSSHAEAYQKGVLYNAPVYIIVE